MEKIYWVYFCGIHSLLFALFHLFFWRIFNWKAESKKMNYANRGILQILNLRLIYIFHFLAFICFFFPNELIETTLGKAFLVGFSLFWAGRTIEQFIFFKPNHWLVNILTVLFISGSLLFLFPAL